MKDDPEINKENQDLEAEKIVEDLSKAYKAIKQLENSISHKRIELTIERKLQQIADKKQENSTKED